MFSLVHSLTKKFFYSDEVKNPKINIEENESSNIQDILDQIEDIRQNPVQEEEVQNNLIEDEPACFYKDGIISLVTHDYVVIENKYMCELKNVHVQDLKKGDKVHYMAYKISQGEELKVRKIISKFEGLWEDFGNNYLQSRAEKETNFSENSNQLEDFDNGEIKKNSIRKMSIPVKVVKRQNRDVFFEDGRSVNLDNTRSDFIPMIGDWLKLECFVEVDENISNTNGEILEIEAIKPLRSIQKIGNVSRYDEVQEYGLIDNKIVFIKSVCTTGYIPCKGDKVVTQSLESEQGVYSWRAISVVPMEEVDTKYETAKIKSEPQMPKDELEKLIQDKGDIEITKEICITLDTKATKEIDVIIKNNGNELKVLRKCTFVIPIRMSQLSLIRPRMTEAQNIYPSDEIIYKFQCKAKSVGVTKEVVIFEFEKFKIARVFHINVKSLNVSNKICDEASKPNYYLNNNHKRTYNSVKEEEGVYIKGVKPYTPARFIRNRPVSWKIPEILWNTIYIIDAEQRSFKEAVLLLSQRIPCLDEPLSLNNYKKRFDNLLFLEEIAEKLETQKYDMKNGVLTRCQEYLKLVVPGLAEKRPSLIVGDRVVVTYNDFDGKKKYEGYIHITRNNEVLLKFDPKFHEKYMKDEECEITFIKSTTVIQRCHTAVDAVTRKLGEDFLFPKKVSQKGAQYNFVESDDEESSLNKADDNENKAVYLKKIYEKKIRWFNKKLNKYQKDAVRNILRGLARPLPYVIFGPPGTGKTITVCESILQILFSISDSRILIGTPSNSSANLISERLLDSKLLQPGDLIRLVAHNYLDSDKIPIRLLPYCVTADISCEGSRADVNVTDPRGCQTKVTLSHIQRHRIIIGTCASLGVLHNMGCPEGHFTHVFVDEAGQASEPEIMIPLSLAHADLNTQIVLAGDPKQLGPINQSKYAGYFGLNDSFLVRLLQHFPYQNDKAGFESGYDPRLITKLLMNYRSLPDLLELPNKLFYEAELIPMVHPDESEEAKLLQHLSEMLPKRLGTPPPVIFHGVNGTNLQELDSPSWYNQEEATQVYIYLLELYNHNLSPDDIGIITPYSKQVQKIKNLLAQLDLEIPKVGSVEEFQGQEKKVIILSTVRTAEDKIDNDKKYSLGFVAARERLNVAITRARTLLIIIGNPNLLQKDVYWRSVLEHCDSRRSWVGRKLL